MLVVFWLVAFGLIFLGVAFWISDRMEVCVSSMTVEVGQPAVVNEPTCR
jgi:hypothetical protein